MNTKAMEAAKEITNLREIEMYTAEEIAAIISKHFPEPSVPVSELKKLERHNFIDDGEIFVMIDGAQFDALIAKVSACDAS